MFPVIHEWIPDEEMVVELCIAFTVQGQHDELEAKFFEERAALESKYQKLYQPLYTKALYWSILWGEGVT